MIRLTSRPATRPASFVAWRWSSLKYAGTVMTALSTVSPRYASASAFSFCRIIALISGGLYCLPPASTRASPFGPLTTLYGTIDPSSWTSRSLRPMKRLIEKTVFAGLVTAWRFATVPTRRSPPWVNATTDGVVRPPSALSMTVGAPPSRTAMHEFVVPRSMPMVLAMCGGSPSSACSICAKSQPRYSRSLRRGKHLGAERTEPAGPVVGQGVRAVERAGVDPDARALRERSLERVRQEMAAEALALGGGEEAEVRELDRAVVGLVELVVAGPFAVDRGDPRLDLLGPLLPVRVGAAEVVGPLVRRADVLVEPAVRRAVGRVDAVDAQLAVDARRRGRADRGAVVELEVGADDVGHGAGHRCTRRARTAASRRGGSIAGGEAPW